MVGNLGVLLLVATLCVGVHANRWRLAAQTLDSDLDSLLCTPRDYPGVIIDIHESIEKGAELLDGVWTTSAAACMSGCCNAKRCDLALFKNDGTSKTGKNCYYVHCGELENCVMVQHSSFTTITFLTEETRTGHAPKSGTTRHSPSAATTAVPVSTDPPTAATPTQLGPTTSVTEFPTPSGTNTVPLGEDGGVSPSDVKDGQMTPTDGGVPPSDGGESPTDEGGKDGSVSPGDGGVSPGDGKAAPGKEETVQGGKSGNDVKSGGSPAEAESGGAGKEAESGGDGCSKYGCDGSGVVAVVVVAVICLAIILVVVAILIKKVVDDRRKRKFRNVDYLINGMYT